MDRLNTMKEGDILFLAGSIPASMPDDIYSRIMKELKDKGVMIVVDATRDLLMNVLKYRPFLIKPNNHAPVPPYFSSSLFRINLYCFFLGTPTL